MNIRTETRHCLAHSAHDDQCAVLHAQSPCCVSSDCMSLIFFDDRARIFVHASLVYACSTAPVCAHQHGLPSRSFTILIPFCAVSQDSSAQSQRPVPCVQNKSDRVASRRAAGILSQSLSGRSFSFSGVWSACCGCRTIP